MRPDNEVIWFTGQMGRRARRAMAVPVGRWKYTHSNGIPRAHVEISRVLSSLLVLVPDFKVRLTP